MAFINYILIFLFICAQCISQITHRLSTHMSLDTYVLAVCPDIFVAIVYDTFERCSFFFYGISYAHLDIYFHHFLFIRYTHSLQISQYRLHNYTFNTVIRYPEQKRINMSNQ